MAPSPQEYTLNPKDVAAQLGVSTASVITWANEGRIPCLRTPGGYRRFRPEDVDAFAQSMLPDTPAAAQ